MKCPKCGRGINEVRIFDIYLQKGSVEESKNLGSDKWWITLQGRSEFHDWEVRCPECNGLITYKAEEILRKG